VRDLIYLQDKYGLNSLSIGSVTLDNIRTTLDAFLKNPGPVVDAVEAAAAEEARRRKPVEYLRVSEIFGVVQRVLEPRQLDVLCRRTGVTSGRRETLSQLGESYGVSRERIRQIENQARKRLERVPARLRGGRLLSLVIERVREKVKARASAETVTALLSESGIQITKKELSYLLLFIEIDWLSLPEDMSIDPSTGVFVVSSERDAIIAKFAQRAIRNAGAVDSEVIAARFSLGQSEVREILRGPFMEASMGWFVADEPQDPFLTHVRLMLAHCSERLPLRLIRSGLRRRYVRRAPQARFRIPPAAVIGLALGRSAEFEVQDGECYWRRPAGIEHQLALTGSVKVLMSLFDEISPVLSFEEIHSRLLSAGYSSPTVSAILAQTPYITRIQLGLYSKVGSDVSFGEIQAARERKTPIPDIPSSILYRRDGTIVISVTAGGLTESGVVNSPHLDGFDGVWSIDWEDLEAGALNVRNNFAFGLARCFQLAGIRRGMRVELAFNVLSHRVNVRSVDSQAD
jgi:hypothetical protein